MRLYDLNEGLSPILFHITKLRNAARIIDDNEFLLTPKFTSSERIVGTKQKLYFMSTSRIPYGNFQKSFVQKNRNLVVMFEIDGRKLSQNHAGEPIEFFSSNFARDDLRAEFEDRVYSDKPYIANAKSYIRAIHVLLVPERLVTDDLSVTDAKFIRILATSGLPIKYYRTYNDFLKLHNPSDKMPNLHVNKDWTGARFPRRYKKLRHRDMTRKKFIEMVVYLLRFPVDQYHKLPEKDQTIIQEFLGGLEDSNLTFWKAKLHADHDSDSKEDKETLARAMRNGGLKSTDDIVNFLKKKWDFLDVIE